MPDFDDFERLVRAAMVAQNPDMVNFGRRFSSIPKANRPRLFKDMTAQEFAGWLSRGRAFLASMYGASESFTTSDLNTEGGDLYAESAGRWIELKTGLVTDANLGLSTVAWAMGDTDGGNELKSIMSGEELNARRQSGLLGDLASARRSQERTMAALLGYFEARLTVASPAPAQLAHFAQCISRHITTLSEIQRAFGHGQQLWPQTDILHADRAEGWRLVSTIFLPQERIVVSEIYRGSSESTATIESAIPRAQVRLLGEESGRTARLYPNYKNSWTKNGVKVPANYWVANACFHVWIDK